MREMHIGLGCAVENMLLADKANGYEAQLALSPGILTELHPNSKPALAATLNLSPGEASVSDLYKAIPNRPLKCLCTNQWSGTSDLNRRARLQRYAQVPTAGRFGELRRR